MAGDDWAAIARSDDADEIRERILTGYRHGKPFTPYVPTLPLPPNPGWVLDFGCGLGRNFPYLKGLANHICGFDLPSMVERCRELSPVAVDLLLADWPEVRTRRFDLVFASLVLQHIDTVTVQAVLKDFANLAPLTYLLTRVETDFGANVLDLVDAAGVFRVDACAEVEHDDATHQLRVLSQQRFEDARRAPGGRHYELLLTVAPVHAS